MNPPTKGEILNASERIAPFIHRTPVLTSRSINALLNCNIYFKCENFQKVGAFKYRGATNAIQQLSAEELAQGVATHSSGNHAQALALAAKICNSKAYIVMPSNAPGIKKKAVLGYGAEVIECAPTLEARETTLDEIILKKKAHFVHPYNDDRIIAGQATAAMELMEDINNLNILMAPVGGGGLLSGTALAAKYFGSELVVFGAEPEGADDAKQSLEKGEIIPSVNPDTIADGLLTSLGSKTFPIIKDNVDRIFTVSDRSIVEAMKLIWQRMKIIVEPSAAVPLAVIMDNTTNFEKKTVGIILSGGNVDLDNLPF